VNSQQIIYLVLGPWLQAILVCAAASNRAGAITTIPFVLLALFIPVAFYIWALRDAPWGLATVRPTVRFAALGFGAVLLSLGGFVIGLMFVTARNLERI